MVRRPVGQSVVLIETGPWTLTYRTLVKLPSLLSRENISYIKTFSQTLVFPRFSYLPIGIPVYDKLHEINKWKCHTRTQCGKATFLLYIVQVEKHGGLTGGGCFILELRVIVMQSLCFLARFMAWNVLFVLVRLGSITLAVLTFW